MGIPLYDTVVPDLHLLRQGKVRDIYDLGENLLMVASDRISAFDVVMPNPVPGKRPHPDADVFVLVQDDGRYHS